MADTDTHTKCDIHSESTHTSQMDDSSLNSSPRRHSSADEIFGLMSSMNLNGQRQRSLSDSGGTKEKNINGQYILIVIINKLISLPQTITY